MVFSYYVVGLPVAYMLGFHTELGVVGICCGCTLGTFVHATLYGLLVLRIDWPEQARLAVERSTTAGGAAAEAERPPELEAGGQEKKGLLSKEELEETE